MVRLIVFLFFNLFLAACGGGGSDTGVPGATVVQDNNPSGGNGVGNDTGIPRVLFVQNNSPIGGDGTLEKPFNAVGQAISASNDNDTIYLLYGDGSPYSGPINLKNGQKLFGQGVPLIVDNKFIIPATNYSKINKNDQFLRAILLSDNNEIAGLEIETGNFFGIDASDSKGYNIHNNIVNVRQNSPETFVAGINIGVSSGIIDNNIINNYGITSYGGVSGIYTNTKDYSFDKIKEIDVTIKNNVINFPITTQAKLAAIRICQYQPVSTAIKNNYKINLYDNNINGSTSIDSPFGDYVYIDIRHNIINGHLYFSTQSGYLSVLLEKNKIDFFNGSIINASSYYDGLKVDMGGGELGSTGGNCFYTGYFDHGYNISANNNWWKNGTYSYFISGRVNFGNPALDNSVCN
jgi:hypothetical protein